MKLPHVVLTRAALLALLFLAACRSEPPPQVYRAPEPEPEPPPAPVIDFEALRRAQFLADILYDAKLAFEDNRLMTPRGNNAYDRYMEVLQLDPGNAVALEGLNEIVLRYVQLAEAAMNIGQYDNAASLLNRAASIIPGRPEIAAMRDRLAVARQNQFETFALDPEGLRTQSLETMTKLAEVAQHIRDNEATFLINARTDEEGRWIYQTMRDAVGGYRLRGNIGISGEPAVLVTLPKKDAEEELSTPAFE